MGRKRQEINPESGKRLKKWLDSVGLSAKALCEVIGYTPQYISDVITGKKRLTPDLADAISNVTAEFISAKTGKIVTIDYKNRVRSNYLLLKDDCMTEESRIELIESNDCDRTNLIIHLFHLHHYEYKDVDNIGTVERDNEGRESSIPGVALTSPRGSTRYFSYQDFFEFVSMLDDIIEMQCAFQFRKMIDEANNIYEWEA